MRLINTQTLKLHEFPGIVPGYAILSHTWGDEEVTLQDWEETQRWGANLELYSRIQETPGPQQIEDGSSDQFRQPPARQDTDESIQNWLESLGLRDTRFGCWKILKACFQARKDGLDWLWVDTNCIDKTSSAELSEAINSMYAWYGNSRVCYAYLQDVPGALAHAAQFRRSRWFTRGWTLQELLAPRHLVFFSREWVQIGTKQSLAGLLYDITGIEERYLLQIDGVLGASIAQRMSWVSNRTTTRPEDIAYCMLGLFDVNMPLIYGEGSKAFVRLQEEIVKVSDDHSIFAWNWILELSDPLMRGDRRQTALNPSFYTRKPNAFFSPQENGGASRAPAERTSNSLSAGSRFPFVRLECLRRDGRWKDPQRSTLLAPDPITFYDSHMLPVLMPSTTVAPFNMTNAGLSISLPIIRHMGDELFFAVIDGRHDRLQNSQTYLCIPLVKHHRHANRFTRTWFPAGPIRIVKRDGREYPSETIEVCRDIQHVPFYYPAFGGASHQWGFWVVFPHGTKNHRLLGGAASPNGVYNNYGVFSDHDEALDSQTIGGLLAFELEEQSRPPGSRNNVILIMFLAFTMQRNKKSGKFDVPKYYCKVASRLRGDLAAASSIANLYNSFCVEYISGMPSSRSQVSWGAGTKSETGISAQLLNNAPMSHSIGADIKIVQVELGPRGDYV